MSVTLVQDGRPTYWAVAPINNGKLFELVAWPPQPEHTFALQAPFIKRMQRWVQDNFPEARFSLRKI